MVRIQKTNGSNLMKHFTYFEGKVYDSSKKYKMAIVCSSSKAGDSFKGAVNSTLFVDELEIIGE